MRGLLAVAVGWATLTTFVPEAAADVAPPPGYVESCTVGLQRKPGEECVSCGDAYHGDRDACHNKLGPQGYAIRCKTRGASSWEEVWCRKSNAPEPTPPPDPNGRFAKPPPEPEPEPEPEPSPIEAMLATDTRPADPPLPAADPAVAEAPNAIDDPPAQPPPRSGCGACRVGTSGAGSETRLAFVGTLLGIGLLGLRRRRKLPLP